MEESEKFSRRDWDSMSPSTDDAGAVGSDEKSEHRLMLFDWVGCCCCF